MTILSIWKASPALLAEKSVKQIISIAGDGKLTDDGPTSHEFRALLQEISADMLIQYANECLDESFTDSGLALQDIINEVGRRLGFVVTNGRYRGKAGSVGNDGLWELPNRHKIVVEVKTTDAFRISLDVIAAYRKELVRDGTLAEEASSILIVVGREDTGGHEAQIRGSRHAWDVRLISVTALLRIMRLKESVDDPDTLRQINQILIPREFTKLDEIVELVFSTAEDAKKVEEVPDVEEIIATTDKPGKVGPKFTPVAFNDLVAKRVSEHLGVPLLKRTRALFSSPNESVRVVCSVSRQYEGKVRQGYWFAFHPHQRDVLDGAEKGFAAFGCGSPENVILIPFDMFASWLDKMNMTALEGRSYWHVHIYEGDGKPTLVRKKGVPRIDLSPYQLQ